MQAKPAPTAQPAQPAPRRRRRTTWVSIVVVGLFLSEFVSFYNEWNAHSPLIPRQSKIVGIIAKKMSYYVGMRTDSPFPFSRWLLSKVAGRTYPTPEGYDGVRSEDVHLKSGLRVRVYNPTDAATGERLPVLVWMHGGGFVVNNASDRGVDTVARQLTKDGRWVVVNVDYRLAPEHRFPAAPLDAIEAAHWLTSGHRLLAHADPQRVIVGGDSAGGNLAGVLAYEFAQGRLPGIRIVHQALVYPGVRIVDPENFTCATESCKNMPNSLLLSKPQRDFFLACYLPESHADKLATLKDTRFSLIAPTSLKGIPSTHIVIARFDAMYDEIHAYRKRLLADGVAVESVEYDDIHGFLNVNPVPNPSVMKDIVTAANVALAKVK